MLKYTVFINESNKKDTRNKGTKIVLSTVLIILVFYSLSIAFSYNLNSQALAEKEDYNLKLNGEQREQKLSTAETATAAASSASKIRIPSDLQTTINSGSPPTTNNFNLTKGFKIEPILWNMTLSSSVTFDDKGNMYIAESGYAPGGLEATPRIIKVDANGTASSFVDRDLYGPITDIEYHNDKLYVSNRAKISIIDPNTAAVKDIIVGLRSLGDFRNNQIAFGNDDRLYFGQGTATNSGIIGKDNYEWLKLIPILHNISQFSDTPAKNVTLTGQNFETENPLTADPKDKAITGAFVPFGNVTKKGQVIKGDTKCNGCILSANLDGTDLKVVGWGFRNPYGLAFDNDNNSTQLIVTTQGAEERGSRPITNDNDKIYEVKLNETAFYGWPDFFGNAEPVTDPKFKSSSMTNRSLDFLIKDHPKVQKPLSLIDSPAGISQIIFSNNSQFGFKGMNLISEFGALNNNTINDNKKNNTVIDANNTITTTTTLSLDQIPNNNTNNIPNEVSNNKSLSNNTNNTIKGQKIIIFDPKKKNHSDFLSLKKPDPSFRPIDLKFNNDGSILYVVSLAKAEMRNTNPTNNFSLPHETPWFYKHTGVLWKITNTSKNGQNLNEKEEFSKIKLSSELKVTLNSGNVPALAQFLEIPSGYKINPILWNMDLPGSFAFDNEGNTYVASTGVTYGKVSTTPQILKIDKKGQVSLVADRPLHGILSDIEFNKNNGLLYVAHRNVLSTVNVTTGFVNDLVVGLPVPVFVTHPMGQIAIGPDGRVYFSVGGLSNTAVPDISDWGIGWIREMPFMHEIPGQDITLTGQNFMSRNFISPDPNDKAITGGMMPFGTPAVEGQKISGEIRCTSCILSIAPDGSDLRLHAWGIRNAYGMIFDERGKLFAVSNGDDDKGIRRVTYDPDSVFVLDINKKNLTFFGWPDFPGSNGESITKEKFNQSPVQHYPNKPLIKNPPKVTPPYVELGMSVGNAQAAYSTNDNFGFKGKIFVAEFGTIAPVTHTFHKPVERSVGDIMGKIIGQKIVMVDPNRKTISDFISLNTPVASFRPVGLGFTYDGNTLYVASIEKEVERKVTPLGGILPTTSDYPSLNTGTIWKIERVQSTNESSSSIPNTNENFHNNNNQSDLNTSHNSSIDSNITSNELLPYIGNTAKESLDTHTKNNNTFPKDNNNNTNSSSLITSANPIATIVKGAPLLREFAFQPNPLIIQKGSTVTWNNQDVVTHTVTSGHGFSDPQMGKQFDSGLIGKTYKHIFKKPGEYPYFCQVHPMMQGKVIVK